MLIHRKTGPNPVGNASGMEEWIHSLKASGNYVSGVPIGKSSGESNDNILRIDTILAEDLEQACPMVMQGFAVREVRAVTDTI